MRVSSSSTLFLWLWELSTTSLTIIKQSKKLLSLELSAQWIDLLLRDGSWRWSLSLSTEERAKRNLSLTLLLISESSRARLDWMNQSRGITPHWWLRELWDSLERLNKARMCLHTRHGQIWPCFWYKKIWPWRQIKGYLKYFFDGLELLWDAERMEMFVFTVLLTWYIAFLARFYIPNQFVRIKRIKPWGN